MKYGQYSGKVAGTIVILFFMSTAAWSYPMVSSTTTLQADQNWLYEYEISNPQPTHGGVWDFLIPIYGDTIAVFTPDLDGDAMTDEWYPFFGGGLGFVQWTADFGYEVLPGETLGGFGFLSPYAPAQTTMFLTTDDFDLTEFSVTGDAPAIPEPATLLLVSMGLCGLAGVKARKRRSNAAK